jgi:hypothetical protein
MKTMFPILAALCVLAAPAQADDPSAEIDYLLSAVGSSDCTFIRNGKRHAAGKAEAHLRMKYNRGRRYATSTEKFIERLASKSSITRRPYMIECPGAGAQPTGEWLTRRLEDLRSSKT